MPRKGKTLSDSVKMSDSSPITFDVSTNYYLFIMRISSFYPLYSALLNAKSGKKIKGKKKSPNPYPAPLPNLSASFRQLINQTIGETNGIKNPINHQSGIPAMSSNTILL